MHNHDGKHTILVKTMAILIVMCINVKKNLLTRGVPGKILNGSDTCCCGNRDFICLYIAHVVCCLHDIVCRCSHTW